MRAHKIREINETQLLMFICCVQATSQGETREWGMLFKLFLMLQYIGNKKMPGDLRIVEKCSLCHVFTDLVCTLFFTLEYTPTSVHWVGFFPSMKLQKGSTD